MYHRRCPALQHLPSRSGLTRTLGLKSQEPRSMRATVSMCWLRAVSFSLPTARAVKVRACGSPAPTAIVGTCNKATSQRSGSTVVRPSRHASSRLRPNPLLKLTRYGRRCKPGLSQRYHRLSPGLQHLPPRSGLTRTLGLKSQEPKAMPTPALMFRLCVAFFGSQASRAGKAHTRCSPVPSSFAGTRSRATSQHSGNNVVRPLRHASPRLRPNPSFNPDPLRQAL